jgi:hypothetical protein
MKRSLALLLTTATLAAALGACAPTSPGSGGSGAAAGVEVGAAVVKGRSTAPAVHGSIATGRDAVRSRVRYSWRQGCPVGRWSCGCCGSTTGGSTGGSTGAS